jgi:hypothetical protein
MNPQPDPSLVPSVAVGKDVFERAVNRHSGSIRIGIKGKNTMGKK